MRSALLKLGLVFVGLTAFHALSFAGLSNQAPALRARRQATHAAQVLWAGQSAGFRIRWTSADVLIESGTDKFPLFEPAVKRAFQEFKAKNASEECTWERDFALLSVVGPIVSFSESHYIDCGGAHPEIEKRFAAIDLAKMSALHHDAAASNSEDYKSPSVALTDYFSPDVVLSNLLADPIIKKSLSSLPSSLSALRQSIGEDNLRIQDCPYTLHADYLERFAFHHREDGKAGVRLGLTSDYGGGCQDKIAQLGLLLPVPEKLKSALELAAEGKEGFLMRNQPSGGAERVTRFQFATGKGARSPK